MSKNPFNYSQIHKNLFKDLSSRTQDILEKRFGLDQDEPETLESIGKDYKICRERVRQIEQSGLKKIKPQLEDSRYQKIFDHYFSYLKENGDLKREDLLLSDLGGPRWQNHTRFWLTLGDSFKGIPENDKYYALWTSSKNSLNQAKQTVEQLQKRFKKKKVLLSPEEISDIFDKDFCLSYIEISKEIEKGYQGLYGLIDWPEIDPRGIKDKSYLVLKHKDKPLHFREVAQEIEKLGLSEKPVLTQTVHNELIRDSRFVLIGRGIYALKEWGYKPGQVKDVIVKILKKEDRPLGKEKIVKKVLSRRMVNRNTVLLNLNNRKYFKKTSKGKYTVKKA